eukprot:TRINITY_DN3751_c0_g1_i1.p3 TRINITY_DN3751_c0_g1~~TRINITY_DN3751_c0_g1_i1.p3  ORF type:complete len:108 (-),score=18.11 TRINITY_DN3751_c0_g1_i1:11-334(-)
MLVVPLVVRVCRAAACLPSGPRLLAALRGSPPKTRAGAAGGAWTAHDAVVLGAAAACCRWSLSAAAAAQSTGGARLAIRGRVERAVDAVAGDGELAAALWGSAGGDS